ncbi:tubulin-tyrosine ligase [Ascobolus immersus RN42]|uniref:Tubulin-tyrosine ligase n=1 Tax=Ascobolus immersus RN42 TaxID=1160509 RepID=A0A3N4HM95_ASCIM|nr:tubulin-tyrosine ligase [Ascobolus immersus RN42]
MAAPITALVDYEDPYVRPKIVAALRKQIPDIQIIDAAPEKGAEPERYLQWSDYEKIDWDGLLEHKSWLACAYIIRKALIRKHHLPLTATHWTTKHPTSILTTAIPTSIHFELDFAEFLDDALDAADAYDLRASLAANTDLPMNERKWWILKPGMSDRGQGLRLFSMEEELQAIFDEWEPESDDEAEGSGDEDGEGEMTSQLRHFVAQEYVDRPLLVGGKKFHIRTYVLAVGALKVYVYREMLALFSAQSYRHPGEAEDVEEVNAELGGHLTNTCLQGAFTDPDSVKTFWSLDLPQEKLEKVFKDIGEIVGDLFESAARTQRVHFQTIPNAFEIFGLDFVVDQDWKVSVLEVNAYPDFKQTGKDLGSLIEGLMEGTAKVAVETFYTKEEVTDERMVKVREVELDGW